MAGSGGTRSRLRKRTTGAQQASWKTHGPAVDTHGARTSSPFRPGLRSVRNEGRDRQIDTDHPAVTGPVSHRGGRRASVRRHAPAGQGAHTGGQDKALTGVAMSPPPHLFHRVLSALAERTGMIRSTMTNITRRQGWTRARTSRVSRDPACGRRAHDTVGLV